MVIDIPAIWRCRFFWLSLVKMDLRTRYRRSFLGLGWSLLHPVAMTTILCLVFHKILHEEISVLAPHLLSGLTVWNFLTNTAQGGCQCFFHGESYIRQYPAPLAIYPLRTALGGLIHFLIALVVVVGLVWFFNGFGNARALAALVPAVFLLFVLGWCLALLSGFANVYFQDTQHLSELFFQMLFYLTPIIYKENRLLDTGMSWIVEYNPVVCFLNLFRLPLLHGTFPPATTYAKACLVVALALVAAYVTLGRLQKRLIFQL